MALAFQNGGLIFSGGGLGQHPACCCKPPPPPSGPMCPCTLFSTCTTTVAYDGLVRAFQSSAQFRTASTKYGDVESYTSARFPPQFPNVRIRRWCLIQQCTVVRTFFSPIRVLMDGLAGIFNTELFLPLCGPATVLPVRFHLVVFVDPVSGTASVLPEVVPQVAYFYKYNLDQSGSLPCPSSLAGISVAAQQVLVADNGCPAPNCQDLIATIKAWLLPLAAIFYQPGSSRISWEWDNTPQSVVGPLGEGELCAHPGWQDPGPPSVSIACAP